MLPITATPPAAAIRQGMTEPPPPPAASPSPSPAAIRLGSVTLDPARLLELQQSVNEGHQPWRINPLEVARVEGRALGFSPRDSFDLLRPLPNSASGASHAIVRAVHDGEPYEIQLIQPIGSGEGGIWVVNEVRRSSGN